MVRKQRPLRERARVGGQEVAYAVVVAGRCATGGLRMS